MRSRRSFNASADLTLVVGVDGAAPRQPEVF